MQALLDLVRRHRIGPFHASWSAGHNATLYQAFYAAPPGAMYPVPVDAYEAAYEPYVVFNRFWVPPPSPMNDKNEENSVMSNAKGKEGEGKGVGVRCDERFAGYGGNKAACVYEHWLAGGGLWVLADHWVVHQSHAYRESARRVEVSSFLARHICATLMHRTLAAQIQPAHLVRLPRRRLHALAAPSLFLEHA